jgi:hypothetical protein
MLEETKKSLIFLREFLVFFTERDREREKSISQLIHKKEKILYHDGLCMERVGMRVA